MRAVLTGLIVCLLGCLAATRAAVAPTLADYGNLPTTQMLSVSPSGKLIALRRTEGDSDLVLVISLERNELLLRTDVSAVLPRHMYFIGDNELVLVASEVKRMLGFRDEFDVSTAFVMDIESGDIRQLLTPGDRIYRGQSGLGRIVGISSDRRHVYMPAYVAESRADRAPDLTLMKVDVQSPRRPRVFKKGRHDVVDYFTSADDGLLAIETYNNNSNSHRILADHDGDWVTVFEDEAEVMNVSFVGVTPDQGALVMLEYSPETGRRSYSALSLSDGAVTRNLFGRDDADVDRVLTDVNRVAYGVVYSGFHPSYRFFDSELDRRIEEIQASFPGQSVWLTDWSDDWRHLAVRVEGSSATGDYFLFSQGEDPRYLTTARPNIEAEFINPIIRVSIEARDGFVVPTLLTVPSDAVESPKNLPAIMLPHGGPQSYDRIEFDWMAQAFAAAGYLVIQPQFRGSDGFGAEHLSAGYGQWGRKMQDDLTDSLQFLVNQGVVDGSRVCIVGGSYGGYASLAGGAFTPGLYRCIVSLSGVSDLPGMLAFERRRHGRRHWIVSYFENFMVEGEATRDKLDAISPVNFAENFTAPVLLIHGENDETVPFEQSDRMYDKLRRVDKDVQLVKLKDENHYLMNSQNRLQSLETMMAFVDQNIGVSDTIDSGAGRE